MTVLERIQNLPTQILNIIIYVDSPTLEYIIKNMIRERFDVHRDYVRDIDNAKKLKEYKLDTFVPPLLGGSKWMLNVNADKLTKSQIVEGLKINTIYGVTVYWTTKYRVYKWLIGLKEVKEQGAYCVNYYLGKLTPQDIKFLYKHIVGRPNALSKELLNFVVSNYNYDVQAVCDLFQLLKSGDEITSRKEIIELIGVGGNNIDSFVVSLLRVNYDTERKKKNAVTKHLKLLKDLMYTYNENTIRNFMLNTIDGFIEMKQLQIMGFYRRFNKEIPENFDSKRLARLKRFEWVVLREITLPRLLNLRFCLTMFNNYKREIALIQAILTYIESIGSIKGGSA